MFSSFLKICKCSLAPLISNLYLSSQIKSNQTFLEQVQNFPQDNNKCKIFPRRPWLQVRISAGRALKERQCTLEGQARYVNVRGSVHWKGVNRVGDRDLGVQYKPTGIKCKNFPMWEIFALDPHFSKKEFYGI